MLERVSANENWWNRHLAGLDFSPLGNSGGTKEQKIALFYLRFVLKPYEMVLQWLAERAVMSFQIMDQERRKASPWPFKKDRIKIRLDSQDKNSWIEFCYRKKENKWSCSSFVMERAKISLNDQGHIIKIAAERKSAISAQRLKNLGDVLNLSFRLNKFSLTIGPKQARLKILNRDWAEEYSLARDGTLGKIPPAWVAKEALETLFPSPLLEAAKSRR